MLRKNPKAAQKSLIDAKKPKKLETPKKAQKLELPQVFPEKSNYRIAIIFADQSSNWALKV